jgi:outer membrane protein assembly factor BamA/autotransporter translocation and assembly factor TamB
VDTSLQGDRKTPARRRRAWLIAGAVLAVALGAVAVLHSKPVREQALRVVISRLREAGIVARIGAIDYSVAALRVSARDVAVAAPSSPDEPFFSAGGIDVELGWGILSGTVDVKRIEIDRPRVALIRYADGHTNWEIHPPQSNPSPGPQRYQIEQVHVRDLGILWRDEPADAQAEAGLSFDAEWKGNETSGPVKLTAPATVRWGDRKTSLDRLEGELSWDGSNLSLKEISVHAPEGTVRADGRLDDLLADARADLRLTIDASLEAVARWLHADRPVGGTSHVEAHVSGALTSPDVRLTLAGRDIVVHPLPPANLDAALQLSGHAAELASFRARLADGIVTAKGRASTDGPGTIRVEWQQLDLHALLAGALGQSAHGVPAARLAGSLDGRWTEPRIDRVELTAEARAVANAAPHASSSLPIDAAATFDVQAHKWTLSADDLLVAGVRGRADLEGAVNAADLLDSSIAGSMHIGGENLSDVLRVLADAGIVETRPPVSGSASADFTVSGSVRAPALDGAVDASVAYGALSPASLRARASITSADVRMTDIDAALGSSSARGSVRWSIQSDQIGGELNASIAARDAADVPVDGTIDIASTVSGSLARPQVRARATSEGLEAYGQRVDRVSADLAVDGPRVTVDQIRLDRETGRIEGRGAVDLTHQTYAAHVVATSFAIGPVSPAVGEPEIPVSGMLSGDFDGEGTFRNLAGKGQVAVTGARWREADLGDLSARITLDGREAAFSMAARDLAFDAAGTVRLDAGGALSVRGGWTPDDVRALAQRLGVTAPLSSAGSARVRFDLAGPRDDLKALRGQIALESIEIPIGGQPIRLARPGQLAFDGRSVRIDGVVLASGASTLTVGGVLGDPAARELSLELDGSAEDFVFVRDLVAPRADDAAPLPAPGGSIKARLTASGSLEQPRVTGSLEIADGRLPLDAQHAVTAIRVRARYDDGVLAMDDAGAAFEGATLTATARVPGGVVADRLPESMRRFVRPVPGAATLSAQLLSVTPSIAAPFVDAGTLDQLSGRVDASIQLEADRLALDRVRGTIVFDRADMSIAGIALDQQTPTRLAVRDGRVAIEAWDWGHDDNRIALRGSATLADDPALDVVATGVLDLRLLNIVVPAVRIAGRADFEVRGRGTGRSPAVDGYVTLSDGEARLAEPRLIVSDVAGTITLTGDAVTLEHLSATINGGDADLSGSIRHRRLVPVDGQITLRSTGTGVDVSGLRAEADANIVLTVAPASTVVGGTVTVLRSSFNEPLSLTSGILRALQSSAVVPATTSPALASMRLDVRLVTADDLLVDNNYAKAAVHADLRIVGTAAQPSVTGRATVAEGGLIFFGRNRFRLVDQGTIDFANPARIEPDLDLRAVTRVQANDITLSLKGTPATLQSSLTSDSPQLSESDLVSMLITGKTVAESTAQAFARDRGLVLSLSGDVLGTAGRAVGIDTVRVESGTPDVRFDAGLVASETDPSARLTFGRTVGRVDVVLSQNLDTNGLFTWIVSYTPRSGLNLRVVSLDDGDRLYGFTHDLTFGGEIRQAATTRPTVATVSEVTVTGTRGDESTVRDVLELGRGDRFNFFRWQDDRERIETYYHEHQQLEARIVARRAVNPANPEAVALAYEIRPGPRTTISVDGFSLPTSAKRNIELAWTRAVVDDFLKQEAVAIARAALADAGFMLPSVTAAIESRLGEKQLRITIEAGQHVRHRTTRLSGNVQVRADQLLALLADRDLQRAVWTDPDRVRDVFAAFYHANGYPTATVRMDPVIIEKDTAVRPVQVDEGALFRLRTVSIDGVRSIPDDEVRRVVALKAGDAFTESAIERAHLALDARYRALGFNAVALEHQTTTVPDQAEVDVTIHVDEGRQQRVRDIVTVGLGRTRPALVSRALKLEIGQPVDLSAWNVSRRRLYETSAFRTVDIQREPMTSDDVMPAGDSGPVEEPIRARVTVQEWPPLRLRYGLEVLDSVETPEDPASALSVGTSGASGRTFSLGVTGDLSARNLFGRAVSAGIAARYTPDFRAARLYSTSPLFFGHSIISNMWFERSRENFGSTPDGAAAFVVDKTTLSLEQRVRPLSKSELSYRFTMEKNRTFDPTAGTIANPGFDLTATKSSLSSTLVVDTRNDLADATRGWFHSSSVEYAPPAFGGSLAFIKYLLQQRYFTTVGRVVFATSGRLGLARGLEGTELVPSDSFFAGGGNSVRGYDQDVLSPLFGGNALLVVNQEVRFPLIWLFRGVAFFDAGRAFAKVDQLSLRDLSASAGFGLRVATPVVLLRLDYAIPFDASSLSTPRARWFFSIGQTF